MLEKIAKWLTRKPKLVAMMAVLMLIPAAIGYISTRINYDILSYLPGGPGILSGRKAAGGAL